MDNSHFNKQLENAYAKHQAGDLAQAKKAYTKLLQSNPKHTRLHTLLGMLCYQNQQANEAVYHFTEAAKLEPKNTNIQCYLGNSLRAAEQLAEAIKAYEAALALDSGHAIAWHNLGACYYQQKLLDKAISCYQKAILLKSDYVDAHYHLGNALLKAGHTSEACELFQHTLKLFPKHFGALFQLGNVCMQQKQVDDAKAYFQQAEAIEPDHLELQINLGHCYLHTQSLHSARVCYRKALAFDPENAPLHFNLGVIAAQENHLDHAINHYQTALKYAPEDFASHYNLALVFIEKAHSANALYHLQKAHALQPDNPSIAYKIQALRKDPSLECAPKQYIAELFDHYASHYDQHLCEALEYQIPSLLRNISKIKSTNHLLDLGCGTGLCGQVFRPICKTITGVDLSTEMLATARQKQCYDQLHQSDLIDFLENATTQYDTIIAGDVLVYMGTLDRLVAAVSQQLTDSGKCLFNIEPSEQFPYHIDQSGRFKHHEAYIEQLTQEHGLQVLDKQLVVSRKQNNEPVNGIVYHLKKL